jgi:molybdate transport system regulatory protein
MVDARVAVRIDLPGGCQIGLRKIALLEAIHAQGSIAAAARAIGITYRSAWNWVEEINGVLREPAVTAKTGGLKGGGAVLTSVGTEVVVLYRYIEAHAQMAAAQEVGVIETLARSGKAPDRGGEE